MILADDILAARGTLDDFGGMISSISHGIEQAERFVLSDDVAHAGYQLIRSKPSSLLDAMPLSRLPHRTMWFEWSGDASAEAGWNLFPSTERDPSKRTIDRTTPRRMGCLVEGADDNGQRGSMTWAWQHHDKGVSVCGLGVMFDWAGDVAAWGQASLAASGQLGPGMAAFFDRWVRSRDDDPGVRNMMRTRSDWAKLADDPRQVEAVHGLLMHEAPWFSKHIADVPKLVPPEMLMKMLQSWEGDITGEAPFISANVLLMNSRRAVEQKINDLSQLNRARLKRGKPPLLDHTITRLYLSQRRADNAERQGFTREQARQHLVRGHFKIRRTGVYWWHPFLRGDAAHPMTRARYEVKQ